MPDDKRRIRRDLILAAAVLTVAAVMCAVLYFTRNTGNAVLVTCDGKTVGRFSLSEDTEILLPGYAGGYNRLVIRDGKATVTEADCRDLICVHHAAVSHVGETIVCLPHRIVITVIGEDGEDAVL